MDDDKGSPEFTVRALRQGDLPGIVNLRSVMSSVLAGVQSISAVQNTLDRSAESHEAWIVEIAGTFIGLAVVFIEGESVAHLKLIYVAPDVPQRHQIIRALVAMTMRDIWERGSLKLIVHTSLSADRFIECLRAFGFEVRSE